MNLSGKDYLTMAEAAHYACVSERQFRKLAREHGLAPFHWMGKKVYAKCDIKAQMDRAWQGNTVEAESGGSPGQPLRVGSASLLALKTSGKRKSCAAPRSLKSSSADQSLLMTGNRQP